MMFIVLWGTQPRSPRTATKRRKQMGRPIKKAFIGNTSASGQKIVGYAWTAGDSVARQSYIVSQKNTHSYVMASVNGSGVAGGGKIRLVNGPITGPGQGNIAITPYGAQGTGATATANLGVSSATVTNSGSGAITASYVPTEVLHVTGGTYVGNRQANVSVNSVTWAAAAAVNLGASYQPNDFLYFAGSGYTTNVAIKVNTINAGGSITGISIVNGGVFTNSTLPVGPFTATSSNTVSGVGATFNARFGVNSLSTVVNSGNYTALPSNPVSFTGSTLGTGAQANLTWFVSTVTVTAGGSGYEVPPAVTFSPTGATATTTLTGGSVHSVVVNTGGSYTAVPTVSIAEALQALYASKITDRIVYTFNGNQYEWAFTGTTLPGYGWAHINSQ